jgi:tetratricopeptide (TPR) repeat protein
LAGRQQELGQLQRFVQWAFEGKGKTVLISGEAGSGKTRLAKEFLKTAKDKVTVLSGWCLSNTAIPYFPFVEAFESYSNTEEQLLPNKNQSLQLKKLLTRHSENDKNQNLGRQAWKDQTFTTITRELLLLSAQKPVIVFIDDIHWADSASLSLLQYLARAIAYERILLLATFRSEELNSQIDVQNQQLAEVLRVMRREDLYSEIKLAGLTQSEVGIIAESMLRGNVSTGLIEKLTMESSGNALFVIESLKFLAEHKGLAKENNRWVTVNEQFGVPDKVKDVILRRLNTLTLEARDVLDAGSVIGDKFDAKLISTLLNQSTVKILSILNSISKTKSLVACENDWFKFDHPKTREVLYEEISLPLKKEYHLRVAEALESKLNKEAILGDLAYHYVNSGDKEKAIKYSLEAGKDALSHFSNAEAIKHFIYVLEALRESSNQIQRATALEGLGDAYHASMMFQEAINTYKQLAANADCPTKVRALRKAMECAFFKNSYAQLKAFLKEAEACDISDNLEKARILMNKARAEPFGQIPPKKVEYFEAGLKLAEEEYSEWDVAWILIGYGSTIIWEGQQEKAIAALLRAAKILDDLGDRRWLIEAYNAIGNSLTGHLGLRKEGIDFLRKAAQVDNDTKIWDYLRLAQLNASWGRALGVEGDLEGALSKSLEALSFAEKTDSDWGKGVVYANLIMFYSASGDTKRTEENYNRLASMPPEVQRNSYVGFPVAKACYLASKKQWNEANSVFDAVFAGLRSVSAPGVEANARICYAEILKAQGNLEKAYQQKQIAQRLFDDIIKILEKDNVYASLMAPASLSEGKTFEMRIDLTNISKEPVFLTNIKNILPPGSQIKSISPNASINRGSIELNNRLIDAFSVQSIKLLIHTPKIGVYEINPQINYTVKDTNKVSEARIQLRVTSAPVQIGLTNETSIQQISFKTQTSEKIYDFLLKAYRQDYIQLKLPKDRSGWRSLMDIVREAKVSRYGIYGFPNSQGHAIAELQQLGLVEIRIFEGERGRGGKITKARVVPEKFQA